jgi:hypothetical protein
LKPLNDNHRKDFCENSIFDFFVPVCVQEDNDYKTIVMALCEQEDPLGFSIISESVLEFILLLFYHLRDKKLLFF